MTTSFYLDFDTITCCHTSCGIAFAVPKLWLQQQRESHAWFYCPNGHRQHFPGETDLEKMRRERDIAKQQLARADAEVADAYARADSALKRAGKAEQEVTRVTRRHVAGTCPCCRRTFSNMTRHINKQHPDYVKRIRLSS